MKELEIYRELTEIFRDILDDDAIVLRPETTAEDVDGWDSQAHVTLVVATEVKFGIKFNTADLEGLHNVGDFVRLIETKSATR